MLQLPTSKYHLDANTRRSLGIFVPKTGAVTSYDIANGPERRAQQAVCSLGLDASPRYPRRTSSILDYTAQVCAGWDCGSSSAPFAPHVTVLN